MILGARKPSIDKLLGRPAMAGNLLDMTVAGEKAFLYSMGPFELIVGYFGDVARYMAIRRKQGPRARLTPTELAAALALNAPAVLWTSQPGEIPAQTGKSTTKKSAAAKVSARLPTTYFSFVERDPKVKEKVLREILGWQPSEGAYAFFYLPALEGALPLVPAEWAVHQKLN
ncbi:MAG: hypothetical protein Fur0032_18930 [Terrimicrobiaceae bacterium]